MNAREIVAFWRDAGPAKWFAKDDAFDAALRERFLDAHFAAARREHEALLDDADGALALILLLDQVPRNAFRDSAHAFATDPLARAVTRGVLARGWDRAMSPPARHFLYMPLMHSEAIADQLLALELFAALGNGNIFGFCRAHARMIQRFGRFPHRNAVLGRKSTPAETRAVAEGNAW